MKIQKIVFFLSLLFIFAGCGNKEMETINIDNTAQEIEIKEDIEETQQQAEKTDGSQTTAKETSIAQSIPKEGGELVLSMRMPKTLNPLINEDITVDNILKLIFEPLFTISDEDLRPIPNIASGFSIAQNGKTVYIDIKDGLYWQDGKPITAKDVIFSLNVVKNTPNSLYKNALNQVESYSNKGNRITINYIEPYSFFALDLCFPIIPAHYYNQKLGIETKESFNPIGSGSYKMSKYRLANELVLEKTTSFKGTPYINTIKILITSDVETDISAFERNITNSISIDFSNWGNIDTNREKIPNGYYSNNFEYLGFNFDKDIFKNVELRKAIAYSLPKEEIVKNIYLEKGAKSISPINPYSFLGASTIIENYSYDIKKSMEALGKTNITREMASFNLLVNMENKERIESAKIIQQRLSQIGIQINIVKKPFDEYKKSLEAGDFDLFLAGIDFGIVPNLQSFLMSTGTGEGGINYQNYKDARMDTLVGNMYRAVSQEEFVNASIAMQQYFAEQLPVVGILFKEQILLSDYTIKGDKNPNMYNQFNNIEKWYIE